MITRREAIITGATLVAGGTAFPRPTATQPIIDTHTHFYDPSRKEGVPWPGKADKLLYRTVLPAEYKKLAVPLGVTGTVVVEASPRVEDNQWLLDLAKDEPFLLGIVGNLQFDDKDFTKHLERFAKDRLFRGIRANMGALKAVLKDPVQLDRLAAFNETGLTLDINGDEEAFLIASQVSRKFPNLRIVVNHMGNPTIDGEPPSVQRRRALAEGAMGKNVFCKLSALVEGSRKRDGKAPTDIAYYKPTLDHVWDVFGENRLLFGSNWPVSDNFAKFETVYSLATAYLRTKDEAAFGKVMGGNALRAYQLKPRS